MATDFLTERRRGAEEAFFAKQNEALRVQLKQVDTSDADPQVLRKASGITDTGVLDTLVGLNVGPEGAAALSLIPLVTVAWADGELDWKERDALLAAAEQAGLDRDGAGFQTFKTWLDEEPGPALLERWKDFATALAADMAPVARAAFREEILGKARTVAAAAGGFLGIGRVSTAEEAVLRDLEKSLTF